MIVVDSSAIIAILLDEPDAAAFRGVLASASDAHISAVTSYEIRTVAFSRGRERLLEEYELLFAAASLTIAAFDAQQSLLAFEGFRRWGKGIHPAGLNFGDCAAYALAKSLDAPLLFKGEDFARTDVRRALSSPTSSRRT
ncbi:MAG: type II toxin-antitoxin system VapC family toxin [Reyranella sp.]|uniref:type II toxin-antitoxin system VapC family toxin n=1 Tax=Reyranella sp. TaxID=1929291 RepID=UPI001AD4CFB9|nr:type II toxin-antitoxin system VapC family toxin [Reyranella sp.]MBN9087284.1 type II toxin-antitoxin system VapC family toxin [Reyranella sp.]